MVARVDAVVESDVESDVDGDVDGDVGGVVGRSGGASSALSIRLLGAQAVLRAGVPVPMPPSRKLRALLAYLALAPRPVSRECLCELLWPLPGDPRGELRGCLSKLRLLLDEPGCERVRSDGPRVALDLDDVQVDAREVERAVQGGLGGLTTQALASLAHALRGVFLDGLELAHCPQFDAWLVAQRRRFRAAEVAVLEVLAGRLQAASDTSELLGVLERWLQCAPFDRHAHAGLLQALARRSDWRSGDEHLAAVVRAFGEEGLDAAGLVALWRRERQQARVSVGTGGGDEADSSVWVPRPAALAPPDPQAALGESSFVAAGQRASIAVMPFDADLAHGAGQGGLVDGLVHDIIVRLSKLRTAFVIAPGTVFALSRQQVLPHDAGRLLHVDYVTAGRLQQRGSRLRVSVELVETRTSRVVWAEVFEEALDEALLVLDAIGHRIVASIASEVEAAERNRAMGMPVESLGAWEAYHRGLWHAYRFRKEDNERAAEFFTTAVRLDPAFSRAHAGLSFTHFQNAFQHWGDRDAETGRALEAAAVSVAADERDPGAHWALGRALWLRGETQPSLDELTSAVELSPNFALGHYALAFVNSQSGDAQAAVRSADESRHLSPFDPLMFAMLCSKAMALLRLGRDDEAADWALKAASRPNAHVHILAVAAQCLAQAGRLQEARSQLQALRRQHPGYGEMDFRAAFRFGEEAQAAFRHAGERLGW